MHTQPLRVGIGGPVGSGKTALTLALCLTRCERGRRGGVVGLRFSWLGCGRCIQ